jgi:hypothetical protein
VQASTFEDVPEDCLSELEWKLEEVAWCWWVSGSKGSGLVEDLGENLAAGRSDGTLFRCG